MEIARVIPRDDEDYEPRLKKALEELGELALKKGAHRCTVIACKDMVFKEGGSGISDVPADERSIFWPEPRFPRDSIQDAVRQYRWAVVFRLDLDDADSLEEKGGRGRSPSPHGYSLREANERIFRIAGQVESASFYKGFYLAIGLAAGNCKDVFCRTDKRCQALAAGKPCRHPLKSRPSIKSFGLDPESIADRAGWRDIDGKEFLMGMVFID